MKSVTSSCVGFEVLKTVGYFASFSVLTHVGDRSVLYVPVHAC
jgi:hypothetical protein